MAYIRTIPPDEATGRLAREYSAAIRRAGRVYQILQLQSLAPRALRASIRLYVEVTTCDDSVLSRIEREAIATVVSRANNCFY